MACAVAGFPAASLAQSGPPSPFGPPPANPSAPLALPPTAAEPVAPLSGQVSPGPIGAGPDLGVVHPVGPDYVLGSGDHLRVIVYGEDNLSGEFFIGGNGKVSLPLLGDVQAAGLTTQAFQDEIQQYLSDGYLKDPKVSAEVLNYRPFFILGEVSRPGQYPFTNGLTVLNAVATAGGFTYRANRGKVYIRHSTDDAEHAFPLLSTTLVAPGDTIRLGERLF